METLFSRHKPKRGMVCLMLAGSLVLHGGLVGVATLWTPPQPEKGTVVIDIGDYTPTDTPGPVRVTEPASETPEATATPEAVDVTAPTPPTPEDSPEDFATPAQTPPPSHRTTVAKPSVTINRPTASQAGSQNPAGPFGATLPGNGNPAGVAGAWVMPHPPYPHMLGRSSTVTGQTTVRITTDAAGRVSSVVIVRSTGNPALDNHTSSYVRNNWHGPPNASRTTEFVYEVR